MDLSEPGAAQIIATTREQPLFRTNSSPVVAQNLQQHGRKHHVPIFATFTLLNADDHPDTVDGGSLQADGFRNSQTCRVASRQDHPVFAAADTTEEMDNFFRAQDDGQLLWFFGKWDIFSEGPFFLERDAVEETAPQQLYGLSWSLASSRL